MNAGEYLEQFKQASPIPEISDESLAELMEQIKPVVLHEEHLHYIADVDPRSVAFTWSPEVTKKAKRLEPIARIETYHSYGAPVFFKPSIAEVIAQIPSELLRRVAAFETLGAEVAGNYHRAETILYRKRPKPAKKVGETAVSSIHWV